MKFQVDEAEWGWLKPHAERDGLILVSPTLNLAEVASSIADDRSETVSGWIEKSLLTKPTENELRQWDRHPMKKFLSVVVQPYVLVQELIVQ